MQTENTHLTELTLLCWFKQFSYKTLKFKRLFSYQPFNPVIEAGPQSGLSNNFVPNYADYNEKAEELYL